MQASVFGTLNFPEDPGAGPDFHCAPPTVGIVTIVTIHQTYRSAWGRDLRHAAALLLRRGTNHLPQPKKGPFPFFAGGWGDWGL